MPQQKPNVKKTLPAKKPAPTFQSRLDNLMRWLFGLTEGWEKRRDIIQNNFELGLQHIRAGNTGDAIFRFKIVTWLEPKYAEGWYYLGSSYLAHGDKASAHKALRNAAKLKPGYEEAVYLAAVAGGSQTLPTELPKRMPLSLVREHFDAVAPAYNTEQLGHYQYRGHELLAEAVRSHLTAGRIDHMVLDLGVGTGLCGGLLRDVSAQITGVDVSAPMLTEAMKMYDTQGRRLYDALIHREALNYLQEAAPESYDVVLACGLVSFMGDVDPLFAQVARVLKPRGYFGLTAEKLKNGEFQLDPQAGRFRFSDTYLRAIAASHGLKEVRIEEVPTYVDDKSWLCVFTK